MKDNEVKTAATVVHSSWRVWEDWDNHSEDFTSFSGYDPWFLPSLNSFSKSHGFQGVMVLFCFLPPPASPFPCPPPLPVFPYSVLPSHTLSLLHFLWFTHICNFTLLCRYFWRSGFDIAIPSPTSSLPYFLRHWVWSMPFYLDQLSTKPLRSTYPDVSCLMLLLLFFPWEVALSSQINQTRLFLLMNARP